MAIQEQLIEYQDGDKLLEGFLAWDDSSSAPRPGVLVSHAWAGRDEFECQKARDVAAKGYVGFALDLYGKGVLGGGPEENTKLMMRFLNDRVLLKRRMTQVLELVSELEQVDSSKIAAMGFCFGGLCVLDLARSGADLQGVVSFHGLFNPPEGADVVPIRAKVLALHGWDDPMVPPDQVTALAKELTDAGADWQIHGYGQTTHAFTNQAANDPDMGTVYQPNADRRSHQALWNFLEELFE